MVISEEKVKAIMELYKESIAESQIAKILKIDRKTVVKIIKQNGVHEKKERSDKFQLDDELVIKIFNRCDSYGQRAHEELTKQGIDIGYSTLMKRIRDLGLKEKVVPFSTPVPDKPGDEFQHDLSPFRVKIDGAEITLQASLIHYRYSKMNYLQFYPAFNRFRMKCFFHQALVYFGFVPKICVVDNTSLVVDRGSGIDAIFNREMVDFAKVMQFEWKAHAIMHSDRKAGVERSFWTIETNFFPGRDFVSLEDLNHQALKWCEDRSKKMNKKKIIPIDHFEYEKDFMKPISAHWMAPYRQFNRVIDQEGYILHETNMYWIGIQRGVSVTLLEFPSLLKIYYARKLAREYPLPPHGTRQKKFGPEGVTLAYRPKKTTAPPADEERELRRDPVIDQYLTFALSTLGPQGRYQFIRQLYHLSKNLTPSIFKQVINRASKYKVIRRSTLERIALYLMNLEGLVIPEMELLEGGEDTFYGSNPDFSDYDKKWGEGHE